MFLCSVYRGINTSNLFHIYRKPPHRGSSFKLEIDSKDRPSARPLGNDRGCENKSNQECHRACREIFYTETEPWSQVLLEHKTGLDWPWRSWLKGVWCWKKPPKAQKPQSPRLQACAYLGTSAGAVSGGGFVQIWFDCLLHLRITWDWLSDYNHI